MARTAQNLIDDLLVRVRDPNGAVHTQAFCRARLSDAQRFINALLGVVIDSASLTLKPGQTMYQINTLLPNAQRVIAVRASGGRDLARLPSIRDFLLYGARWARHINTRADMWTTVGRDLLIIYPAPAYASALTIYYAKLTTAIASGAQSMEVDNEYSDLVTTLTEALLLLRQRDLAAAQRAMERLSKKLAPELAAERLHVAPTDLAPTTQKASA